MSVDKHPRRTCLLSSGLNCAFACVSACAFSFAFACACAYVGDNKSVFIFIGTSHTYAATHILTKIHSYVSMYGMRYTYKFFFFGILNIIKLRNFIKFGLIKILIKIG